MVRINVRTVPQERAAHCGHPANAHNASIFNPVSVEVVANSRIHVAVRFTS
jgi:hypothetical protein